MKAIFFNIWHGTVWDKLESFIQKHSGNTDIFAMVEVDPTVKDKIDKLLPGFSSYYYEGIKTEYLGGVVEGRIIYFRESLNLVSKSKIYLYEESPSDAGGMLSLVLEKDGKKFNLGLIHGKSKPGHKLDTPERLEQGRIIIDTYKNSEIPVIFGGDFNLLPEAKSVKMMEDAGYVNLIKKFNIKETRNRLCWEQFPEEIKTTGKQHFADYCFISPDVEVVNFNVPNIEASDHEPLILEFELK